MSVVFVLIFLAAVAGLFKPYISGLNRKHFGIAAAVSFLLVGLTAPKTDPSAPPGVTPPTKETTHQRATPTDIVAKPSNWEYSSDKDEMRGTLTRYASVKSTNDVDLDFPYGTISGEITIRQRPEDGLNVMFSVEKGQILCHSYSDSYVSIKIDSGPIKRYSCTGATDGSSETAFLSSEHAILGALKSSKKVVVEAEFFQKGRQQFLFDTAGLEWK